MNNFERSEKCRYEFFRSACYASIREWSRRSP